MLRTKDKKNISELNEWLIILMKILFYLNLEMDLRMEAMGE